MTGRADYTPPYRLCHEPDEKDTGRLCRLPLDHAGGHRWGDRASVPTFESLLTDWSQQIPLASACGCSGRLHPTCGNAPSGETS